MIETKKGLKARWAGKKLHPTEWMMITTQKKFLAPSVPCGMLVINIIVVTVEFDLFYCPKHCSYPFSPFRAPSKPHKPIPCHPWGQSPWQVSLPCLLSFGNFRPELFLEFNLLTSKGSSDSISLVIQHASTESFFCLPTDRAPKWQKPAATATRRGFIAFDVQTKKALA